MRTVDARGLSCPQPVVMFHMALKEENGPFDVLVNNAVSVENVTRAATKKGFQVTAKTEDDGSTRLELRK